MILDLFKIKRWTSELEQRFISLATLEAIHSEPFNLNKAIELEQLTSLRRKLTNPRTKREISHEYQQNLYLEKLMQNCKFNNRTTSK